MERRLPTRAGSKKKVDVHTGYRYVTPAVRLERKQISMLKPSPGPAPDSDTPASGDDSTTRAAAATIVGKKGPLEEEGSSLRSMAPANGQSPGLAREEPEKAAPSTKQARPPSEEQTRTKEEEEEEEEEARTQEPAQEETKSTRQEHTKETEPLRARTTTTAKPIEARTTPTATERVKLSTRGDDSESTPQGIRSYVQFADTPVGLQAAELLQFFEEEAPSRKDSGVQIAVQSVRPEAATVMEFFEEQPVRQESVREPQRATRQRDTPENVMEYFEEQDQEEASSGRPTLLVVPPPQHHGSLQRSQRSPSPGSLHASVGLSHLDNLIRLMEQLSNLKDENARLRKRCDYLETTKNLLKARSELMSTSESSSASGYQTLPSTRPKGHRHHHHHPHHHHHYRDGSGSRDSEGSRPRLFSAEDVQVLEISESASDSRPKRPKGAMHKRSFSTGSLEVEILDETSTASGSRIGKSKSGKSVFPTKSPKQKSKGSKWARVKKVLTGQFLYEDLGTTLKSLKELGRSGQRYSSVSTDVQDYGSPTHPDTASLDTDLLASRLASTPSGSASASSAGRSPDVPGPGTGGDVEELGTEIWMGPPGWWEQYEARKRQSEASVSSDVSSVIEVKTMYLGSKQKDTERLLKVKDLPRRQSSPSLTTKDGADDEEEEEGEEDEEEDGAYQVHGPASYRGDELVAAKESGTPVGKTAERGDSKKLHRKAWGRVKEMIHVRKDSVKKTRSGSRREKDSSEWSQSEEVSEVDTEGLLMEQQHLLLAAELGEGLAGRSGTPGTSPLVIPRQTKSVSESPPQGMDPASLLRLATSSGTVDVAALLAGSLSEEFAKKMHAWQELQLRKSSSFKFTSSEAEGEGAGVDGAGERDTQELLSTATLDGAEKSKPKATPQSQQPLDASPAPPGDEAPTAPPPAGSPPAAEVSPTELQAPSVNVEELQRRISESFSRKLAEWERRKYRRPTTPEMEPKAARGRKEKEKEKEERSRSKKSREEKERERQEKAREREMQKVEKEQVKLEKEKVRIEKERLRAMERQAKLERMKGRLSSHTDTDPPSSPPPALSGSPGSPPAGPGAGPGLPVFAVPAAPAQDTPVQSRVSADFRRKLEEWEQFRSSLAVSPDLRDSSADGASPSPQPCASPPTFTLGPTPAQGRGKEREKGEGQGRPPPLSLQPYLADTPDERSPVERAASDASYGDDTSVTEESYTRSNIVSLERANSELLREVQHKETEYAMLQEEVLKLNNKLDKVRQEHAAEMARFRMEVETGAVAGPVQLEVGELESTVRELEEKIVLMETAGDQLAESMESAAIGKWQSMEGEEAVSHQLVDMVEQMKGMLLQASQTREQAEKTTALQNFEKVYSHAMKLQVQMNNLRVSQLERNKEIMLIKRQLLLQEVNNVLLQAHITRREAELYQYREARRYGHGAGVRRWNTFSGQGDTEARPPLLRNISLEADVPLPLPQPPSASITTTSTSKHSAKHDDIPLVTDEDASILTPGVAKGEPQLRGERREPPLSSSLPTTTTTPTTASSTMAETSTDHREQHMATPAATTTAAKGESAAISSEATSPLPSAEEQEQAADECRGLLVLTGAVTPEVPPGSPPSATSLPSRGKRTAAPSRTLSSSPKTSGDSRVETRSPTLPDQTSAAADPCPPPVPAPAGERRAAEASPPGSETPTSQPIPESLHSGEAGAPLAPTPSLYSTPVTAGVGSHDDVDYSQPEPVMECTDSTVDAQASSRGVEKEAEEDSLPGPPSSSRTPAAGDVDISRDRQQQELKLPVKSLRSPVLQQKYFRRQREEREQRTETVSSTVTAQDGEQPQQSTPGQSPTAALRSKSVGDVDGFQPPSSHDEDAELRRVMERFEKRATMCETTERKLEFRKTPSPTLHLPRVGLVSRVRRLKPAAELLQESQRYRSGQSAYAARIMQRYGKQGAAEAAPDSKGTAVSSEGMPVRSAGSSRCESPEFLQRTFRPGPEQPDLDPHHVHFLSSSSGPVDPASHEIAVSSSSSSARTSSAPLRDLTAEGQASTSLAPAFGDGRKEGTVRGPIPTDQIPTEADLAASDRTRAAEGSPLQTGSVTEAAASFPEAKPDSTISPTSHVSMPSLASHRHEHGQPKEEDSRERASTYCGSEGERPRQLQPQQQQPHTSDSSSIEHIEEELLQPALLSIREGKGQKISPTSSTKSKNALCCQSSTCTSKSKSSSSSSSPLEASRAHKQPSSPKSQERKISKEKMGTIGVLCKQSMSFDLGVSRRAQSPEALPLGAEAAPEESLAQPTGGEGGGEGAQAPRPSSTSSEGEVASTSSDDKKKSRPRFLDAGWLQKPKKFFKVSK